jgi:hypothetical protein
MYHGCVRVGVGVDTGANGQKTYFTIGSKDRAILFLEQLFSTFQREGFQKNVLSQQQIQQMQMQQQLLQQQQQQQQQMQMMQMQVTDPAPAIVSAAPIVTPPQRAPVGPPAMGAVPASLRPRAAAPAPPATYQKKK